MIDEVHLLNESRGSALEAGAVGRIKLVSQKQEMQEVRNGINLLKGKIEDSSHSVYSMLLTSVHQLASVHSNLVISTLR